MISMSSILKVMVAVLLLSGCSGRKNEKAKQLYLDATEEMQRAKDEGDSYSSILRSYEDTQKKLELLLEKYPSSDISIGLVSGQSKITGLTWDAFNDESSRLIAGKEAESDALKTALFIIGEGLTGASKARPLSCVAIEYYQRGEINKADKYWERALTHAKTSKDKDSLYLDHIFYEIDKGVPLSQLTCLRKLSNDYYIGDISEKYAKKGEFSDAMSTAKLLDESFAVLEALETIANFLIDDEKDLSELIQTAKSVRIETSMELDSFLVNIASKLAQENQFYEALALAKTIEQNVNETSALIYIADAYSQAGSTNMVVQVLKQAMDISINDHLFEDYPSLLTRIALLHGTIGKKEEMESMLLLSMDLVRSEDFWKRFAETIPTVRHLTRLSELKKIILACIGVNENPQAWSMASDAFDYALEINIDDLSLSEIADKYIEYNYLKAALIISEAMGSDGFREEVIQSIAEKYIELGLLGEALDLTEQIGFRQTSILRMIAEKYSKQGQQEKAKVIANQISTKYSESQRLRALIDIAESYLSTGLISESNQLLSEILVQIQKLDSQYRKALLLIEISPIYHVASIQLTDIDQLILIKVTKDARAYSDIWE